MKKIFKYVPIILGLVMVMSSCGDDEEDAPAVVVANPTLAVSVNGNQIASGATVNVETGASITLAITANKVGSGKDLDVMSITQSGANSASPFNIQAGANDAYNFADGSDQSLANADDETFTGRGTFTSITGTVGSTNYNVTVKDKDGNSTSVAFTIVVADPTTPLATSKSGSLYHIGGSLTGAWNVSSDTSVASGSMQTGTVLTNTDVAGVAFTGGFNLSTGSTMVVAAAGWDYANATVESSEAAYNAGTAVTVNASPAVGDMYIIKMANSNYVAVKVTAIDAADNTCVCGNTGKMSFDYKKN